MLKVSVSGLVWELVLWGKEWEMSGKKPVPHREMVWELQLRPELGLVETAVVPGQFAPATRPLVTDPGYIA